MLTINHQGDREDQEETFKALTLNHTVSRRRPRRHYFFSLVSLVIENWGGGGKIYLMNSIKEKK